MHIDADLRAFIDSRRIARLATVDDAGRPHLVPVCFALDAATAYTAVDEKPKRPGVVLRRRRNIAANPHVQLLLDVYDDADWTRLRYVQLRGRARIIAAGEEHTLAIALLRTRYVQYAAMDLESRPVIAIDINHAVEWQSGAPLPS